MPNAEPFNESIRIYREPRSIRGQRKSKARSLRQGRREALRPTDSKLKIIKSVPINSLRNMTALITLHRILASNSKIWKCRFFYYATLLKVTGNFFTAFFFPTYFYCCKMMAVKKAWRKKQVLSHGRVSLLFTMLVFLSSGVTRYFFDKFCKSCKRTKKFVPKILSPKNWLG